MKTKKINYYTAFGNSDVRENVLVRNLEEEGLVVEYLCKEIPKYGGPLGCKIMNSFYNICDGPAIKIALKILTDEEKLVIKDKEIKADYKGYFIEGVVLYGSDKEVERFKPILENILNNPKNKNKGF